MLSIIFHLYIFGLCWIFALTLFLPLTLTLMFSRKLRSAFFPIIYEILLKNYFDAALIDARKKAFQMLRDRTTFRDRSVSLEILEIGVGYGGNLKFYPNNVNLTVLDKNKDFGSRFQKNAKKFPNISYQRTIIQPAEDMRDIADNSFDVVVSTYLHCSTDNSRAVLREVKRILKPGGFYVFLDHVSFPKYEIGFFLQLFISPLWYFYCDGCHLQRDVISFIKEAEFSSLSWGNCLCTMPRMFILKHQIVGVATK